MAFNTGAFARNFAVLMVAILLVATQMGGKGVSASRYYGPAAAPMYDNEAYAPAPTYDSEAYAPAALAAAPVGLQSGFAAGTVVPSLVAPVLMVVLSFVALKHL